MRSTIPSVRIPSVRIPSVRRVAPAALGLLAALALAGCRDERARDYEPGVYKGEQDEQIDEATRQKLRERVRLQNFN